MTPEAATAYPEVRTDWDSLGTFFYNPHPVVPGMTQEVNGIHYPEGTKVVIVAGKHYVIPCKGIGVVQRDDPNYGLVMYNVSRIVGTSARNDYGVRRIDLEQLSQRGQEYLEELDKEGANVLAETLYRTVVESLEKENESRAAKNLPARTYDRGEKLRLAILKGLTTQLRTADSLIPEKVLAAAEKAASEQPHFEKLLAQLPIATLRKKAAMVKKLSFKDMQGLNKEALIAIVQQHKNDEALKGWIEAGAIPEPADDTPPTDEAETGEDDDEIASALEETVDTAGTPAEERASE